jgi:Secretion system C-terminal sorting domain
MKRIKFTFCSLLALTLMLISSPLFAQSVCGVTDYAWPTANGQAIASDKYKVWVKDAAGNEKELQVLMSNAISAGDWMHAELTGRTLSIVNIAYNSAACAGITFRVEKLFGTGASDVKIAPRSYGYNATLSNSNKTATFTMDEVSRYISVDFVTNDNKTTSRGWIKHMLCINVDTTETDIPSTTATGVVVYNNNLSATTVKNASILYFPPGYHNLKNFAAAGVAGGNISVNGQITIVDNQSIYLAGGAFVEGLIERTSSNHLNQKLYGRGIWTGRQYTWSQTPGYTGIDFRQLVNIGRARIEGLTFMDSPNHGIVSGNQAKFKNIKFYGWHSNNDAIRTGSGSEISFSFLRAVDDFFYNFDNWVHDCVLWAGHNGAILTYGWGGDVGGLTYNSGSSLMENIDIINPEWIGLGNNNGIVAAQVGYDYKPFGYGGSTQTVLRNFRIEGSIPGLVNLKPRSGATGNVAIKVPAANVGYLGDLLLENFTVDNQFSTGLIRGEANAANNGTAAWLVKNVEFKNVKVNNTCITASNFSTYITVSAATSENIQYTGCIITSINPITAALAKNYKVFPNPFNGVLHIKPNNTTLTRNQFRIVNTLGKTILQGKVNGNTIIDTKAITSGYYLLEITSKNGNALYTIVK